MIRDSSEYCCTFRVEKRMMSFLKFRVIRVGLAHDSSAFTGTFTASGPVTWRLLKFRKLGSQGDETPVSSSHKRMSSAVNYKGWRWSRSAYATPQSSN